MKPRLADIYAEAARQEGLTVADLQGQGYDRATVLVRQRAAWACHQLRPDVSNAQIGAVVGRPNSTVYAQIRAYSALWASDAGERLYATRLLSRFSAYCPVESHVLAHLVVCARRGESLREAADRWGLDPAAAAAAAWTVIRLMSAMLQGAEASVP